MIGLPWLKMLPWGIAALMAIAAATCLHLYQSERDSFVAYRAEVTAIGKAQEAQIEKERQQAEENLKQGRQDYENKIPVIRRDAVASYRMRYPQSSRCEMPGNAAGQQVDDGTAAKCVADEFIADAADDAAKVTAWQDWCKRNNCPVESP